MNQRGFTLIELLIVVAIIAILAAIAIPNFLAAQVRSKVSKLKAEFRSLATAVESYNVDNNTYPIYNSPYGQDGVLGDDGYGSNRLDLLTTPVAYITSYAKDPFIPGSSTPAEGVGYFLYTWETQDMTGSAWYHPNSPGPGPFGTLGRASYWAFRSRGPDLQWNSLMGSVYILPWTFDGDVTLIAYDPSNGTVSRGELYRTSIKSQN